MTVDAEHTPQRHATRAPVDLPVKLHFDDSIETVDGRCTDISIGGMFLNLGVSRPPGTLVRFELMLEDENDTAIRGLGEVVWMRARAGGGQDAGMGLKFRFLEQQDRQQIFKLVSEHIKERLAHRHGSYEDTGLAAETPKRPTASSSPASIAPKPITPDPITPDPITPDPITPEPVVRPAAAAPSVDAPAPPSAPKGPQPDLPRPAAPPPIVPPTEGHPEASGGQQRIDFDRGLEPIEPLAPIAPPLDATPADPVDDLPLGDLEGAAAYEPRPPVEPADVAAESGNLSWDEADETYTDYLGDDHFEHRPAPRRGPPLLPIIALGLVGVAVLVYFFGGRLVDGDEPVAAAPAAEQPATPPAEAPSSDAPAEPSGGDADPPVESTPPSEPSPAATPRPVATPPVSPPPPASPPARATPPPSRQPAASNRPAAFRRITDVQWRAAGRGIAVVVTTDGPVRKDRFDSFRLENPPREVVRIYGLEARWAQAAVEVGRGGVARLRSGWHQGRRRGNELHLVFDLTDGNSRLTSLRSEGRQIIVELAP